MTVQDCAHNLCTGCFACLQVCPCKAISKITINGFEYPSIDGSKCVDCGKCTQVCPIIQKENITCNSHRNDTTVLAAWNKSDEIRLNSSSGGIFYTLASKIIDEGGVVFGAAWDKNLKLKHTKAETKEELLPLLKSKYVQSDSSSAFLSAKKYLKAGRKVLFSGTPCQTTAMKLFCDDDNLLLVDVLCQGVPSPIMFEKFIKEIEISHKKRVENVVFRSKSKGWRNSLLLLTLYFDDGTKHICKLRHNEYYRSFYKEYYQRQSCYECPFKVDGIGYSSDITIADYWRIGDKLKLGYTEKEIEKGISAVIVNTERGKKALDNCSSSLILIERPWTEFSTNSGLRKAHVPYMNNEAFDHLRVNSWHDNQRMFFRMSAKSTISQIISLLFGYQFSRRLKRLMHII